MHAVVSKLMEGGGRGGWWMDDGWMDEWMDEWMDVSLLCS
jgi:hypothetical protein